MRAGFYLACKFNDAVLADDIYFDFAGIFDLFLDALGDIAGERVHRDVGDLPRAHEDPYLTASCDGIYLFHAREGACEAL